MIDPRCLWEISILFPSVSAFTHLEVIGIKAALRSSWSIWARWTGKFCEASKILLVANVDVCILVDPEDCSFIEYGGTWLNIFDGFPAMTLASHRRASGYSLAREVWRDGKSR